MNWRAEFIGHNIWVDKALMKMNPVLAKAMADAMVKVRGRAIAEHLRGPYPLKLSYFTGSRTAGALSHNIQIGITDSPLGVLGMLLIPMMVFYGKIWEAVDEYAHRVGGTFKNGSPMARPWAHPAFEDMRHETLLSLRAALARGIND